MLTMAVFIYWENRAQKSKDTLETKSINRKKKNMHKIYKNNFHSNNKLFIKAGSFTKHQAHLSYSDKFLALVL